jgi:hypothetical protein
VEPRYRIRDGIGFCRFDDRTIILDVEADRYWQLGPGAGAILEQIEKTGMPGVAPGRLEHLEHLKLVEPLGRAHRADTPRLPLPRPSASAVEASPERSATGWFSGAEVLLFTIAARSALKALPLKSVLHRTVARRRATRPGRQAPSLASVARSFHEKRQLVPLRPACLSDSIAFLWFASRRGHAPRLVFGVEAYPFAAHCWAQEGELVLTDALEHATMFKPILIL